MRLTIYLFVSTTVALCSGCATDLTCDDPMPYQLAQESQKLVSPDGLDVLQEGKEMRIPRASPQDPRAPGSPCLDIPPVIRASDPT